jgi:anti-sigma factor RsiW
MTSPVPDALLSAFVDGELPPLEAARVAEAISTNPALAQRVARLHKMKAALAGYDDGLPLPDMPQLPAHAMAAPPTFGRKLVAAAVVAAVLGVLVIGALPGAAPFSDSHAAHDGRDIATALMVQHDNWLQTPAQTVARDMVEQFAWMHPVTSASGLKLVHYQSYDEQMHLGFKGPNACRLSIFISTTDNGDAPLRLTLSETVQHARWQRQGYAFEMIARDMAPARFATVATGLQQGSKDHGADGALHIALLHSARLPCLL